MTTFLKPLHEEMGLYVKRSQTSTGCPGQLQKAGMMVHVQDTYISIITCINYALSSSVMFSHTRDESEARGSVRLITFPQLLFLCLSPQKALTTRRTYPMWSQLYGVCYCLSNSCAVVLRHNRRFDYRPQFQDRQKPHPLISRRAVRRRHYRSRIKSQKTAQSAVGVVPTTFRAAATDDDKD